MPTKAAPSGKATSASPGGKKPNGLQKPMQPSKELAAVVGAGPLPRGEVVSRVWAYIKKNNLQDQVNKRNINADDNLRKVFGGKNQVSMFEMTALVNKHLKPA